MDDPLHSPVYRKLARQIPQGGMPIHLQLCWDGAEMHHTVMADSMWPVSYSIMNFSPCLRNKLHVGLHVMAFDNGSDAALDKCAEELQDLFLNPIISRGIRFYVIISQILMDGQGRNKYCKLEGQRGFSGGCHVCDFKGRAFGSKRTVYIYIYICMYVYVYIRYVFIYFDYFFYKKLRMYSYILLN